MNKAKILKLNFRKARLLDMLELYSDTPKAKEAKGWFEELEEGKGKAMALSNWISVVRRENPAISDALEQRKRDFKALIPKKWLPSKQD
jgi:hypothetical protein